MTPQAALQRVIEHREIFHDEMLGLMRRIMTGEMSSVVMAAFVTGLRVKKETVGELAAAARSVYVDVREAILGLTSPIAPERGLVGAVEEYARRFSEASKLVVAVDASDATSERSMPAGCQSANAWTRAGRPGAIRFTRLTQ